MMKNPHVGSSLDEILEEDGVLEEVEAIAKKRVLSWHSNQSKLIVQRVKIGAMEIDCFMLPNGSYQMSQTQAAECVGKLEINIRRFLNSEAIEALLGENYTPDSIEMDSFEQSGEQTRFNTLPLKVVIRYWFHQARLGNKQAISLICALATKSLEQHFDTTFGISHPKPPARITQAPPNVGNFRHIREPIN